MRVDASARSRLMPPSVAESVAVFRARAHAPARARALCTSPLLRFVSCPLSLSLSLPSSYSHDTSLSLAPRHFFLPLPLSLLLSVSLFFVSRLRCSCPLRGPPFRPWEQIHSPSPTIPRNVPSPTRARHGRALRSLAPRPRRVYIPHSPYLHLYALPRPALRSNTSDGTRTHAHRRHRRRRRRGQPREHAPFAENKSEHNR